MKKPTHPSEIHAQILYSTYCECVGEVAFNGDKLPTWDEFVKDKSKSKQVNAWLAVGAKSYWFTQK